MKAALRVDRGVVRTHNEDAALARTEAGLFAVADGMGGHDHGEVASRFIVEALEALALPADLEAAAGAVRESLEAVHARLLETSAALGPRRTIGATTAVLSVKGPQFVALWAGDCRVYLRSGGALRRLTKDHTVVQSLVDIGEISEEEAARHPDSHKVTRAVGADARLRLDQTQGRCAPGDRFLLCSDGLGRVLSDRDLEEAVGGGACAEVADALLAAALAGGAPDNLSIVVVDV